VIVGCNHGIQPRDADAVFGDSEQVTEQKTQFANLIESLIIENDIEFIGEEWGRPNLTYAHALADANPKSSWADINTTLEELDEMKIPRDYVHGAYSPEQKRRWTRQREAVMFKKILERKGKATKYMVICGFEHLEPLAEVLGKDCNALEFVDYRQEEWYDAEVFAE